MRLALPIAALAISSACTFEPGAGFGTVQKAVVAARLRPSEARDLGGGTFLTDLGYRVRIDSATIAIARVELEQLSDGGGGGAAAFDPSDPPPGYSLCHGGHCHRDDGALVPYAEIQAELSGGSASFEPILTLPVERTFDMRAGTPAEVPVLPSPELPLAALSRVEAMIEGVTMTGAVLGGPALRVSFDGALGPMRAALERQIDRSTPSEVDLLVAIELGATWLDGVELGGAGPVTIGGVDTEAGRAVAAAILGAEIVVSMEEAP